MNQEKTATYKTISDSGGNRYLFFCDISGAHVCTTKKSYHAKTPTEELYLAWETEGRHFFNYCHHCGKWVVDEVYNAEVLECVECAPYDCESKSLEKATDHNQQIRFKNLENFGFGPYVMKKTRICVRCGRLVRSRANCCPECGEKLPRETLFDRYRQSHLL